MSWGCLFMEAFRRAELARQSCSNNNDDDGSVSISNRYFYTGWTVLLNNRILCVSILFWDMNVILNYNYAWKLKMMFYSIDNCLPRSQCPVFNWLVIVCVIVGEWVYCMDILGVRWKEMPCSLQSSSLTLKLVIEFAKVCGGTASSTKSGSFTLKKCWLRKPFLCRFGNQYLCFKLGQAPLSLA